MTVSQELDRKQFFQPVLETINLTLKLPACIWLVDEPGQALRIIAATKELLSDYISKAVLRLDEPSVASKVVAERKTIIVPDIASDKRWKYKREAARMGLKSAILVPLRVKEKIVGVLDVYAHEARDFSDSEKALIESFAAQVAVTQRRIRDLAVMNEVSLLISSELQPADLFKRTMQAAEKVLDCKHVSIFLMDRSGDLVLEAASSPGIARERFAPGEGLARWAAQAKRSELVPNAVQHPRFVPGLSSDLVERSMVLAPIVLEDKVIGVISADMDGLSGFDEHDQMLLEALASQVAVAVRNARLFEQRKALQDIARNITAVLDKDQLLQTILERSMELLDCKVGSIASLNRATGELEFQYAIGKKVGIRLPVDKGLMTAAAQTRQPVRVGDVTKDPRYFKHVEETRSELDVPLLVGDELVGVLNAESPRYNAFGEEDKKLAMTLASQAAVALYNAALFERRRALADFGQAVTSGIRLREAEVLESIHKQATRVMDTDNMYIALYDDLTDTVRFGLAFMNGACIDVGMDERWQPRKGGKGKTEHIIHTKKPLFQPTMAEAGEWYNQAGHKEYVGIAYGSWLGVPMMVGEKVLGVIATYNPTRDYVYSTDDLEILQAMANQAAIAIDNARLTYGLEQVVEERTLQLREAQEKALAAEVNAAVGIVTAEVAHHSKNLAGIIRSCAIRLRRQLHDLTPQQQEDLGNILLNSEGILRSAEDLFKPFRPEPKAEVSVDLILREALDVLGRLPDIDIRGNLASDLPEVTVQVQKVTSYITELLNNAVKFTRERMKEKGIDREQIEVGGRLAADGFIELTFTNHGPVIPPEHWEDIFKLFSAREEKAQEARSHGLGLWGARTTMRAHGGDVYVLASSEERTIFLLRLPAQQQGG